MSNSYLELKAKHEKMVNDFPMMVFAFSQQQFKEAMEKLGLTENDTDKIYSIGGGGFIRKTDSEALSVLFETIDKETQAAIDNDLTGDGYVYDMFLYELENHEYGYTGDPESTLDALGLTEDEVTGNEKLYKSFRKACKKAMSNYNKWNR